jgi:hypothetical protein
MTISLSKELEGRLREHARRHGVEPAEYAARLIEQHLPPVPDQASIDILDQWEAENATDDPAEQARQREEGEEFMRNLARNREEMEGPGARKLWP